jgi:hypothetical protein
MYITWLLESLTALITPLLLLALLHKSKGIQTKKKRTFQNQNPAKSKYTFMFALLPALHGCFNFAFHSVFAPLLILNEVL